MKKILVYLGVAVLLLSSFTPNLKNAETDSCKSFFPIEKGTELTYQSFNHKDKLQTTEIMTITDVVEIDEVLKIEIHAKSLDNKDKEIGEIDFEYICEGGQFKMSMESLIAPEILKGFEGMEVNVVQTDLSLPANLTVGQTLPDAEMEFTIASNGIKVMSMKFTVTDRKVEGQESITTPAGTFDCYKLSQSTNVKMIFMDRTFKSTSWVAEDIGQVRNESYDQSGNLENYEVLTNIKQ